MFPVFHLARSTWSATKTFCCGLKECSALIGWFAWCGSNMAAFVARQVVSSMKNEQQSQNLLLKVDQRSTFHNTFLQPATNDFVAEQVDRAMWKTGNINKNLQRNNVAWQVEGFCISYFAAFIRISSGTILNFTGAVFQAKGSAFPCKMCLLELSLKILTLYIYCWTIL